MATVNTNAKSNIGRVFEDQITKGRCVRIIDVVEASADPRYLVERIDDGSRRKTKVRASTLAKFYSLTPSCASKGGA